MLFSRLVEDAAAPPQMRWYPGLFRCMRALFDGRFSDAEHELEAYRELGSQVNDENIGFSVTAHTAILALERGTAADLLPWIDQLARRAPLVPAFEAAVGAIAARAGDADLAVEKLASLPPDKLHADPMQLFTLALLAEAAAVAGGTALEYGTPLLCSLRPYRDRFVTAGYGAIAWGAAARPLGMLAAALEDWCEAEEHFERALRLHRDTGARPFLARTLAAYGDMLAARRAPGDLVRASLHRRHARDLAAELGMAGLARELDRAPQTLFPNASANLRIA